MGFFSIKKIICLFLFVIFLSGCTANYNIEIKDNKIIETAEMYALSSELDGKKEKNGFTLKDEIDFTYDSIHDKDNGQEEKKTRSFNLKKINDNNKYGLLYNNELNIDNYAKSPLIEQCYDDVRIDSNNYYLSINTSNSFKCFDYYQFLDNIKISVNSNYQVISNNADEVNGKVYTWIITRDNYKAKTIQIKIDKSRKYLYSLNEKQSNNIINITLMGIGILIFIASIYITIKVIKSNK